MFSQQFFKMNSLSQPCGGVIKIQSEGRREHGVVGDDRDVVVVIGCMEG